MHITAAQMYIHTFNSAAIIILSILFIVLILPLLAALLLPLPPSLSTILPIPTLVVVVVVVVVVMVTRRGHILVGLDSGLGEGWPSGRPDQVRQTQWHLLPLQERGAGYQRTLAAQSVIALASFHPYAVAVVGRSRVPPKTVTAP